MNLHLLIIDPQNDFAHPKGNLFVPHADQDSERLAMMLKRGLHKINAIHVTLDTHHWVDIAHPIFWSDRHGKSPAPFTLITYQEILEGQWQTRRPEDQIRATQYVQLLKTAGRYDLTIWPPHCLIGHPGHNVVAPIAEALMAWEDTFATVNYVSKGFNPWTEHYSAIKAEVPDPEDLDTRLNTRLLEQLQSADLIAISGQALSHCVANTVRDIADHLGGNQLRKLVLIEDTSSAVPGFEELGERFITDLTARGMQIVKSMDFW